MCGPLCDAVRSQGVGPNFESLERSNLLLVPLTAAASGTAITTCSASCCGLSWTGPSRAGPKLHVGRRLVRGQRAAGAGHDHAQAAGNTDRAARLVAAATIPTYAEGRVDTVSRWLQWFEDRGAVERHLPVAVLGTFVQALLGKPAGAERWMAAAEHGSAVATLPDGSTTESWVALTRALLCRDGVGRMRADAEIAVAGLAPASRWRPPALLFQGVAYLLEGHTDRADSVLAHAVEVGITSVGCRLPRAPLASGTIVAMERDD